MKLSDSEKRDLVNLIERNIFLPEKYRFLLFEKADQVELIWNGKSSEVSSVVLPFQVIEQIDEPRDENVKFVQSELIDFQSGRQLKGWTNKLIWGDNKYILSSLKNGPMREEIEKQGGIKLIYIDPPFDVGADFTMNLSIGENQYEKQPNVLEKIAYRDTWGLGSDSYLSMIYERLLLLRDLLSDDGSIYVHCDHHIDNRMRGVLEEVFGIENFVSHIVWKRTGARSQSKFINPVTDSIFFFAKNINAVKWKGYRTEYSKDYIEKYYSESDEDGRLYQDTSLIAPGKGYSFEWKGITKRWRHNEEKFQELEKNNLLHYTSKGVPRLKRYLDQSEGIAPQSLWADISNVNSQSKERLDYPTQKPEQLLERIIKASSEEGDIVLDCFVGSGTTAAVCEKLNRKWICSDLGKFSIHTTRKRMIGVQREIKKEEKNWRAFEILNLGKYQREHFIYDGKSERDENKIKEKERKEKDFENLILEAYNAKNISGFTTLHGKKDSNFVSIGPINQPLSRNHVEEVISECLKNKIIAVDILGFEYEMGLFPTIQEEAKDKGLRLTYKQIPMDIFDKRAVSNNEVYFHNVAYIDFKVHKNGKKLGVELTHFAVFYNEDNFNLYDQLPKGKSKIVTDNGNIIEKSKDNNGIISEKLITKSWTDWIDYWSVDFNYESKKEIIKVFEDGKKKEIWTGNYIFENEWQSFKSPDNGDKLEFRSVDKEISNSKTKVAVKVIDIFGNDTMKLIEVDL